MKLKVYQILNIVGLVAMIAVNYLANTLPIGGRTTGEVSAGFRSLFTPAGFTFSIWGIIYLLLIAFSIYQSKGIFSDSNLKQNRFLYRIDSWFFISCIANMAWLFAWHHQVIWLSVVFMAILLGSLIMIYLNLGAGKRIISRAEHFLVHVPFSVYLGWITVATIANVSIFLVRINWDKFGFSDELWTVVMISIATAVGIYILLLRKDFFYSIVIVWAFLGIISKRLTDEAESMEPIILTAGAGILMILAINIFYAVKRFLWSPDRV
ncbi:MAG: hypothetical protein IH598_05080 [Bacteroidales bacterium]|nr:hypothetical protein [Bacteroidales bacterium]